jgi:hypothetical protein
MRTITIRATALSATAALGLLAASTVAHAAPKKSCVLAGGEATMITLDLAKFMANAALGNSIKGMGATAEGPVKMACKDPAPLTYCLAQQKACK